MVHIDEKWFWFWCQVKWKTFKDQSMTTDWMWWFGQLEDWWGEQWRRVSSSLAHVKEFEFGTCKRVQAPVKEPNKDPTKIGEGSAHRQPMSQVSVQSKVKMPSKDASWMERFLLVHVKEFKFGTCKRVRVPVKEPNKDPNKTGKGTALARLQCAQTAKIKMPRSKDTIAKWVQFFHVSVSEIKEMEIMKKKKKGRPAPRLRQKIQSRGGVSFLSLCEQFVPS